jgi:hypothetical protein
VSWLQVTAVPPALPGEVWGAALAAWPPDDEPPVSEAAGAGGGAEVPPVAAVALPVPPPQPTIAKTMATRPTDALESKRCMGSRSASTWSSCPHDGPASTVHRADRRSVARSRPSIAGNSVRLGSTALLHVDGSAG